MQSAKKRWWLTPVILLCGIVLLHLLALQGGWVEKIYSVHVYPVVSSLLRILTGWIPFSLGDVLYGAAALWLLYKIIKFFIRKPSWRKFFLGIRNLVVKILWIYFIFLIFW